MATVQSPPEAAASSSNYKVIFDNALKAYKKKTGKDLAKDPLLRRLETCNSPDSVLDLLKDQIPGFDQSASSDEKLTKWVIPVVNVLYNFASTISGAVSLVSPDTFKGQIFETCALMSIF
jgi:fungal STAND N-terminal Goodbye domain